MIVLFYVTLWKIHYLCLRDCAAIVDCPNREPTGRLRGNPVGNTVECISRTPMDLIFLPPLTGVQAPSDMSTLETNLL